ncbi:NAD(P)H-binding protein [soil metagenome]
MSEHVMIIGATGLVGHEITRLCLRDPKVKSVSIFVRRPALMAPFDSAGKLTEHIVDFDRVSDWANLLNGDVLFSAMGTTARSAGSQDAQYKVDYQYQWDVAHAARLNGCKSYVLISAAGANAESVFFYLRTKGELENDVAVLGFPALRILQPSLLKGDRSVERLGESLSELILGSAEKLLSKKLFPLRLKPIPVETLAHAALQAASKTHEGTLKFGPADLWSLAAHDHT